MQNLLKFNLEWTQHAFPEGAMTDDQFVIYAREVLFGEGAQCLDEFLGEIQNEMSMFGDSGPGTMIQAREMVDDYNKIAKRYTQFTGQIVQSPRLPTPRYTFQDDFDEDYRF